MSLRVNSLGVNTQSSSDSATTLISNRALIDHNYEGIVTSAGSVTKWLNTANRSQAAYFDGVNDFISTPDSGALALTGDIIKWNWYGVAATDFTPTALQILTSQYDVAGTARAFNAAIDQSPTGGLQLVISPNGAGGTIETIESTVATGFTDSEVYDIEMELDTLNDLVYFRTCPAGGVLTQLGNPVACTVRPYTGSATPLNIGCSLISGSPANFFKGYIQRFTLHDDDRLAASWSADDYTDYNATTMESVGPELWTGATSLDTGWTDNGDGSYSCDLSASAGSFCSASVPSLLDNVIYRTTYTITDYASGAVRLNVYGDDDVAVGSSRTANGIYTEDIAVITATGNPADRIGIQAPTAFEGTISNISVKAVATYTLNNGAIIRDPYDMDVLLGTGGLRRHDSGAVLLDGVSGSYVSTPDSAAASVTGDITLIAYAALNDWTPPTDDRTLIGKYEAGGAQASYIFRVDITTGQLEIVTSFNGLALVISKSTVAPAFTDGTGHWCRVSISIANNTANFYTSDDARTTELDAISWTLLGDPDVAHVQSGIFDSTSLVTVGAIGNAGNSDNVSGQIYRACVIDGILPQGLEFGEDIVTNGDFADGETGWTFTDNDPGIVGVTSGVTLINRGGAGAADAKIEQTLTTVVGCEYIVQCAISDIAGASTYANLAVSSLGNTNLGTTNGIKTTTFTASATSHSIGFSVLGNVSGSYNIDNISVKPTAALAVDFDARLAGLTAGAGDKFFGAEMLKPSARTINLTDWTQNGTGSITDNGDGTVTLADTDVDAGEMRVTIAQTVATADTNQVVFRLSAGTAAATKIRLQYNTGGTTKNCDCAITWSDPLNPTLTNATGAVVDLGGGEYQYTVTGANNSTGNLGSTVIFFPAGENTNTGSVIVHGEVSHSSRMDTQRWC
jgi:hypothetical protein